MIRKTRRPAPNPRDAAPDGSSPTKELTGAGDAGSSHVVSARAHSGVGKALFGVTGMILLSRLTGFLRGSLLAYFYGQNRLTDAYGYAFTIPDVLWQLVAGGALYAAFVPVISEYFSKEDDEGAWRTFSVVFTFLTLLLLLVLPLLWIFARPLLHIFAPGLGDSDPMHPELPPGTWLIHLQGTWVPENPLDLAVRLTRIVIPAQMCFFLGSLLMGCQQSAKRFMIPAFGPVVYNLGLITGGLIGHFCPVLFGGKANGYGIAGFSWGALTGAFVGSILLQLWGIRSLQPRFQPSLDLAFPGVKKCGKLVLPVLLGVSLPQVDQVINGYFVGAIAGGRSILDYTNRLMQVPLGIFGQAIGMVILPTLSSHAALKDTKQFKATLGFGIRLAMFLTVPAAVLIIVLAGPLIAVVYQHGNFHQADTQRAIPTMVYYALGIPAWSAQAVIARGFYARQDTLTPVVIGSAVTGLFVFLNWLLVWRAGLGVAGAAIATTLAASLHCLVLFLILWRRIRGLNARPFIYSFRRLTVSVAGLWAAAVAVDRFLPASLHQTGHGSILVLILAGGAGSAVYIGIHALLGGEEMRRLRKMLPNRAKRSPQPAKPEMPEE